MTTQQYLSKQQFLEYLFEREQTRELAIGLAVALIDLRTGTSPEDDALQDA